MPDFTVVVLEGAYPSSIATTLDMLRAARTLAPRLGLPEPTWRVCSADGGIVEFPGGLAVATTRLPRRSGRDESVWILPGMGTDSPQAVHNRLARRDATEVMRLLAGHAGKGGRIAASCSAVFLLAGADLLDGARVTTTWWLAPLLAAEQPSCTVDADRMVCADGALVTAGAAFAQTDLMLHLLRERFGSDLTGAVARSLLIDARQAQSPYIVPEVLANGAELVAQIIRSIEDALPNPPGVAELAAGLAMSERTLSRHVVRATGKSTLALVQSVKLRRARTLLETSRLSVEQIALAVGYQDATALRRAMKKAVGANPSAYRSA